MGILSAIKSLPILIGAVAIGILLVALGVERHGKLAAEAKVEAVNRELGAAQASIAQWHGAATECSNATEALAAKLASKQTELDQVAAQKIKVVTERRIEGHQMVAGAYKSKSCEKAVADFVASFQPPPKLQTSAKPEARQ